MTRLTEEMVIARAKQSNLALITKLNCWGSDLSDVSIIRRMRGVEVLALSVNNIATLAPFEDCTKLQELYLRKNNINSINEVSFLQNLPNLKYLWLEENPLCDEVGPNYRAVILRILPNLKKLDNVDVTQEELDEALRGRDEEETYAFDSAESQRADSTSPQHVQQQQQQPQQQAQQQQQQPQQLQQQQQPQHNYPQHSPPQMQQQQYHPQQQQQQQRGSSSPIREEPMYSTSPKHNTITKEHRTFYHQNDRSPGSDQESPHAGYREVRPTPLPPSISTHSMKEYYQSDRPAYPAHYRHSQTDLTEWEEHQQNSHNPYGSQMHLNHHQSQRRLAGSAGPHGGGGGDADRCYGYRNGSARENGGEYEPEERQRARRPEVRYSDSVINVSTNVLNHYAGYHRRPVNRNSNLLSACLCLVKEMDYASLEVLEHAVRCRIDELPNE